jgi:hypothetical protein
MHLIPAHHAPGFPFVVRANIRPACAGAAQKRFQNPTVSVFDEPISHCGRMVTRRVFPLMTGLEAASGLSRLWLF